MSSETTFIDLGDVRLRVRLDGPTSGPPLIFSNSLGAKLEMWDPQVAHFSKTFRCIRYDVRGHGESSCPRGPWSISLLAADALRILDTLHIHKADWAGCSMGGIVGQYLLAHHRERIGKAVLGNTAAQIGFPGTDWNPRIRMAHEKGMGVIAEAMKPRWFSKRFNEANPAEVSRITDQVREASVAGYTACCAAIRDSDLREAVKTISNPVLVVIGAVDPATTPAMGEAMFNAIPGAQKFVIDAAHISNCELPDAYNKAVAAFLEG